MRTAAAAMPTRGVGDANDCGASNTELRERGDITDAEYEQLRTRV